MLTAYCQIIYGTIDAPITRKENSIIERCISPNGQKAITTYKVLKVFSGYSLVECILKTGRTHQIRVHMSYIGNPLLGDNMYNTNSNVNSLINRQALHSYQMEFIHPIYNKKILLKAELPSDIKNLIT